MADLSALRLYRVHICTSTGISIIYFNPCGLDRSCFCYINWEGFLFILKQLRCLCLLCFHSRSRQRGRQLRGFPSPAIYIYMVGPSSSVSLAAGGAAGCREARRGTNHGRGSTIDNNVTFHFPSLSSLARKTATNSCRVLLYTSRYSCCIT